MRKSLIKPVASALTLTTMLALGFLSFIGMFSVLALLPICGAAFFMAFFVESQVYWQNLLHATASLSLNNAAFLKRAIIRRYLKDLISPPKPAVPNNPTFQNNAFLQAYKKQLKYYEDLNGHVSFFDSKANQEREIAHDRLVLMEDFLLEQLTAIEATTDMEKSAQALLTAMGDQKSTLQKELRNRPWILRTGYLFALAAGISTGLASFNAIQLGLITLGISSAIPGGLVVTLGIFAAVGYCFLMYQSIFNMLSDDTFRKYFDGFIEYCSAKPGESRLRQMARCIGISIVAIAVMSIAIFATIATAGTWWYAAKDGLTSLTALTDNIASYLSRAMTVMFAIPTFIFNTINALPSAKKIIGLCKNGLSELKETLLETWQEEVLAEQSLTKKILGAFRFFNPFRALVKVLDSVFFIGHVISTGMISAEGIANVPASVNIACGAATETLTDLPYVSGHNKKATLVAEPHHHHDGWLMKIIKSPITICACLAVLWDFAFSSFADFKKSKENFFEAHDHTLPEKPKNSAWLQQAALMKVGRQQKRLSAKTKTDFIQGKLDSLGNLKNKIADPVLTGDFPLHKLATAVNTYANSAAGKSLGKHRHAFFNQIFPKPATESAQMLAELQSDFRP